MRCIYAELCENRSTMHRHTLQEREKRAQVGAVVLKIAKTLLPTLAVSQQNLHYYASLADFYTIYDLQQPDLN
jgi:hypothetical protein